MGKTLVICEKKSVAQDVAKAFGGAFAGKSTHLEGPETVITWAVGHLAELADPEVYDPRFKKWRMDDLPIVPERFTITPRDGGSGRKQLDAIEILVARDDVERVVNACDAGREGELIFAYTMEVAHARELPVQRAWFSSMTRTAIRDAFDHLRPGQEMHSLEEAARSRSEADWLVGINATRAATVKARSLVAGVVSLGRVQTPTLAIMVTRELEIAAFTPVPYWIVDATFQPEGKSSYAGRWIGSDGEKTLPAGDLADQVVARVEGGEGTVAEVRKRTQRRQPPLLYDLTSLQREASNLYGFTARRTLSAAQGCYEKAVLTYPRTASRYLSTDMIGELTEIAGFVGQRRPDLAEAAAYVQGLPSLPLGRVVNDAKVTDHHAVIPTNAKHDAELSPDEARIYDMAARRFLAVFHPEAVFEATTLVTEIGGERFRSSGRVMIEAGWRAVYGETPPDEAQKRDEPDAPGDDTPDQNLPALADGEKVACTEVTADGRETQPPRRYGEAALLAAMEGAGKLVEDDEARDALKDSGIGTPATRAAIIERLIDVGYVVREGRSLVPTQKAIQVIQLLDGHELTSPELTGRWEKRLLDIERGVDSRDSFMDDIAQFARRTVNYFGELPKERTRFTPRVLGIRCPRCEATGGPGELIERRANFGCTTWQSTEEPGCGFVVWKTLAGKHLSEDILRELLENGRTKELPGFRSKAGKPFRAMLVLDREAIAQPGVTRFVSFEFAPRPQRARKGAAADSDDAAE